MSLRTLIFVVVTLIASACTNKTGAITIINNGEKPLRGNLGDNSFTVPAGGAHNFVDVSVGEQQLEFIGQDPKTITITENRTAVFDPITPGCYVLADYRSQYLGKDNGSVKVIEQFQALAEFTPKRAVTVPYNEKLPAKAAAGQPVTRLQSIACDQLKDKKLIAEQIMRLP